MHHIDALVCATARGRSSSARPVGGEMSAVPSSRPSSDLLAEVRHLALALALVERDELLQRVDATRDWPERASDSVQTRLELVEQDLELAVVQTSPRSGYRRDRRSTAPRSLHARRSPPRSAGRPRGCSRRIALRATPMRAPFSAPASRTGSVVSAPSASRRFVARIAGVARRPSRASSIAASATVRAIGPAVSCECAIGMMPARLTRPSVGLMPTMPLAARRTDDRSVGLGAHADGREVGRDRDAACRSSSRTDSDRARTGSHLPAAPAPAARRLRRAEVRPLAQVGLAEDHGTGGAQALDDECVCATRSIPPAPATRPSSASGRRCRCCP